MLSSGRMHLYGLEQEETSLSRGETSSMNRAAMSSLRTPQIPIGVLTDNELLLGGIVGGKRVLQSRLLPLETHELSDLLEYLWQQEVTSVWVLPGSQLSERVTSDWLKQVNSRWTALVHPAPTTPDRPACALFFPRGQQRRLTLAFPEHAGWDWKLSDALSLLATVTYLDQVLAQHMVESPQMSAQQLLTSLTMKESLTQLRTSPVNLWSLPDREGRPIPFLEGATGMVWMRALTLQEQRQRYLHKYTFASRALRACLDVQLGAGTPQLSPNGRACDGIHPGIWRVHLDRAGSLFDGKMLPGCLDQQWVSTPQVTCCRTIGYEVQVQEGYSWPESHQVLKPWATFLWQAIERIQSQPHHFRHAHARANASESIKQLADHAIALLCKPEEEGGWSRPDWWVQILGRKSALLFADLVPLVRRGTMPVLVHGDAFWTVSADHNPLTAVPGLLSNQRWNGYTPGYDVPLFLSKEVQALFRGREPVDQVVSQLDNLAGEFFS